MHGTAERRHNNVAKALRKYKIYRDVYPLNKEYADWLKEHKGLNCFSKNKIHCSCPMCSGKQKYRGSSLTDKRRILSMKEDLSENDLSESQIKDRYEKGW